MMRILVTMVLLSSVAVASAQAVEQAVIRTNHGDITLELYDQKAPLTVRNFLAYADQDFYQGTVFHRVIADFMIQGGGFTEALERKPTREAIPNEAGNGLRNRRGTIAMARTAAVDSATSQFFINLKDNPFLDHRGDSSRDYGYAVFGRVIEGMAVVDRIGSLATRRENGLLQNLPVRPIVIEDIERLKP